MRVSYLIEQTTRGVVSFEAVSEEEALKHLRSLIDEANEISSIPGIQMEEDIDIDAIDITGEETENMDLTA